MVHAKWWDHPELGKGIGKILDENGAVEMMANIAQQFARFADFLGDRLSGERRRLYETVLSSSLKPWKRIAQRRGLTVAHGDAHLSNFLYPRVAGDASVFLIDWQLWHIDVGVRDLAFMIALPRERVLANRQVKLVARRDMVELPLWLTNEKRHRKGRKPMSDE